MEKLRDQIAAELNKLKKTTIQQLWTQDLDRLEAAIKDLFAKDATASAGKGKRGKRKSPEEEPGVEAEGDAGEGGDAEESAAPDGDVFGSLSGDVARWTSSQLKVPGGDKKRTKMQ